MQVSVADHELCSTSREPGNSESPSYCIPERSVNEKAIAILVFVVGFAYLFLFRRYTGMEPDEGIILQGAQRILAGEVLYRDFFSFFTPGSYYLQALISRILGNSFLLERTTLVLLGAAFSVLNYLLARRACSRGTAFTIAILTTAT